MLGLYGDNGKKNGNYYSGFRETNNTWFKVQGLGGWASNKYSSHRIQKFPEDYFYKGQDYF